MALTLISSFPDRLKEALADCSITDFARKIGVSKQTISAYTVGTRKPKAPVIKIIAEALNVNEAWLMGYDTSKERLYALSYAAEKILSSAEFELLQDYRCLNEQGKEYIRQTMAIAKNTYKQ